MRSYAVVILTCLVAFVATVPAETPRRASFDSAWRFNLGDAAAPGVLKAVARKDGKVVATDEVHTAGKPAKLVMKADRSHLKAGDHDMSFVTVSVEDADGNICPNADDEIKFTVDGPANIAGVDNGDATNHESFQGHQHKVFHGLGLVVLAAGNDAGEIHLTASGEGLTQAAVTVTVK